MRAIKSWLVGLAMGSALGAIIVVLLAPFSDEEARRRMRDGYREALKASREAAQKRRAELEAEFEQMHKRPESQD